MARPRFARSHGKETLRLRVVTSAEQILCNIQTFWDTARRHKERARSIVARTEYWVFDEEGGLLGPGKFVGFQGMTFTTYEKGKTPPGLPGATFDGGVTRKALLRVLGRFRPSPVLSALLASQLSGLLGTSVYVSDKWRFNRVPAQGPYGALLCNPSRFDGATAVRELDELTWTATSDNIRPGARVAIWQSAHAGGVRGVVALGEVTRGVSLEPTPAREARYWKGAIPGVVARVRVRLTHVPMKPLWVSEELPWLRSLTVARARGGTVFTLDAAEWHALASLCGLPRQPLSVRSEVHDPDAVDDDLGLEEVRSNTKLTGTEKRQLIQARLGQGLFRRRVAEGETSCRITGVADSAFLVASHIKPWREATNVERLDGNNGLLLTPTIDRLFDRGYISFRNSGSVLVSPQLPSTIVSQLGLSDLLSRRTRPLRPGQCKYMAFHRTHVFRRSAR